MKKMLVVMAAILMVLPLVATNAFAQGECVACHTMHASKQGSLDGNGPNANLLRFDCMGCHANDPTSGTKNMSIDGTLVPQVAHGGDDTESLAGGNFSQASARKVHSVVDVTSLGISPAVALGENNNDEPPGIYHSSNRHAFTSDGATEAFDEFTCAGARGCHGTRSQALIAASIPNGTGQNEWVITSRRTGLAALTGAHHNNQTGALSDTGYNNAVADHSGNTVGAGYRFIPGLFGFENEAMEFVSATDHNEYYGKADGFYSVNTGCDSCHVQDTAQSNTRAGLQSGITMPNNSMSGFCSTCHSNFHSAGGVGPNADRFNNGVSGAFLRHPSDYVIPATGEYAAYTAYDESAPVARPTVYSAASGTVTPGTDMVMCLSCHVAHGSEQDYMLRFDYLTMTAGSEATTAAATAKGGCLACHTAKGVVGNAP